jgi:hypothetical protein
MLPAIQRFVHHRLPPQTASTEDTLAPRWVNHTSPGSLAPSRRSAEELVESVGEFGVGQDHHGVVGA